MILSISKVMSSQVMLSQVKIIGFRYLGPAKMTSATSKIPKNSMYNYPKAGLFNMEHKGMFQITRDNVYNKFRNGND